MSDFRGFIAVDIQCTTSVRDLMERLKRVHARLKLVEAENIHITLKFLGNTKEENIHAIETIMKEAICDIKPFRINLTGTGVFPDKKYISVVWIGIENDDDLKLIASRLDEGLQTLGYKRERKPFSPHVTIARVKRVDDRASLISVIENHEKTDFGTIEIDSIKLKKSDLTPKGPVYSNISTIPLGVRT